MRSYWLEKKQCYKERKTKMKYVIYLDNQQIEELECDELEAHKKYDELLEEFKGEYVYDKITLFKLEIVKEDNLEVKEVKDE